MKTSSFLLPHGTFIKKKFNSILVASTLGWLVSLIDSCADTFIAGACLGDQAELAVSAISLVTPFASVISFLAYLVSMGTAIVFSQESGAFRHDKAYGIVGQGLISAGIVSVILVILMVVIRDPLMAFYDAGEEITALAKDYFECEVFFAAIYPVYYIVYQLVGVDGDEKIGTIACIVSAVSNVFFSLWLVKPYGIRGLALGTIFATLLGLGVYCLHFFRKCNSIHVKFRFVPKDTLRVIKISSSTSMTLLYMAVIDIVFNRFVIATFGNAYLPAYTVVNLVLNLGAVFCSLYEAASGFVSVAYGERNPDGIKKTMQIALRASLVFSLITLVGLELLAPSIPNLYGITSPAVRDASVFAARLIALSCPATALYYLFCSYYPTVERVLCGHIISAVYMLVAPLALAIPLGLAFGFNGLSWGFALSSVVALIVTVLFIAVKYGKKAVPLVLPDKDGETRTYDLRLTAEDISNLCVKVKEMLEKQNIPSTIVNEVQLILEESYMTIMEKNPKKKVLTECDLLMSDTELRLITRDNGCIFDITDANAKVENFRGYVLARLMERNPDRANTTTISFNRNSYCWQFKEE